MQKIKVMNMVTCKWLGYRGGWALQTGAGKTKAEAGAQLPHSPGAGPGCLPALLQSTRKELFWPTKAFESPAPLEVTLLASEDALGMAL